MKSSITKRIMAGIVCAMVAVSICGCSEKPAQSSASESSVTSDAGSVSEASDSSTATGTAAEITAKIQEDVKFPGMAEIGEDRRSSFYDVDSDKIVSYSAFICGSGGSPDEIAVFEMSSSDDIPTVKKMLEERVAGQKSTCEQYPLAANYVYMFDDNNVVVNGNFVALIICADNAKAIEDFKAMAK